MCEAVGNICVAVDSHPFNLDLLNRSLLFTLSSYLYMVGNVFKLF